MANDWFSISWVATCVQSVDGFSLSAPTLIIFGKHVSSCKTSPKAPSFPRTEPESDSTKAFPLGLMTSTMYADNKPTTLTSNRDSVYSVAPTIPTRMLKSSLPSSYLRDHALAACYCPNATLYKHACAISRCRATAFGAWWTSWRPCR